MSLGYEVNVNEVMLDAVIWVKSDVNARAAVCEERWKILTWRRKRYHSAAEI
jgi:hypothetical protein